MFVQYKYSLYQVTKNRYIVQRCESGDGEINAGALFPETKIPGMVKSPEVWTPVTKRLKWAQAMEVILVIQHEGILESYVKFPNRFLEELM